jgi:superfamily II DNA/RNA helicase
VVRALGERDGRTLVFVEKKRSATWLKKMLRNGGASDAPPHERFTPVAAEDIHGDRSQSQREAALAAFRSGACRVLVATDVAARGLDVAGVEHVINMDLPFARDDFDSYAGRG